MSTNDCTELKSIKYKSMMLNGNKEEVKETVENLSNLDVFLEGEKQTCSNEQWIKLDKTTKLQRFKLFVETIHKDETEENKLALYKLLATNLDRKKLLKAKDVVYNKETRMIESIPALLYNSTAKRFTLKRCDKRPSTLKSLAPKKVKSTDKIDINK